MEHGSIGEHPQDVFWMPLPRNYAGADAPVSADTASPADPQWIGVTPRERARCEKRARDLRLMATGSPDGLLDGTLAQNPDPAYDPATVARSQAIARMSERLRRQGEKGRSPRQLARQLAALKQPGGNRRSMFPATAPYLVVELPANHAKPDGHPARGAGLVRPEAGGSF